MRGLIFFLSGLLLTAAGCYSQASHSQSESPTAEPECGDCCAVKSRAEMLKRKQEQKATPQSSAQQ